MFSPYFINRAQTFVYLNLKLPSASLGFILDLDTKVSILRMTARASLSILHFCCLSFSFFFDRSTHSAQACLHFFFPGDAYGTVRNFGKPISIPFSFLQGEVKARAWAAQDYENRTDRPVNTCENLVSRHLRPCHRSFLRLTFLASGKSDFFVFPSSLR